jgi:phosphomannomutase / phosphoglucomutase
MIDPTLFRSYDIRGIVDESLTTEVVFLIGKALGSLSQEEGEKRVVVACDGRLSSPALLAQLTEGLLASGCDVLDIGMVPTPLLYYATHILQARSGVMVTGSHNPAHYNGLKMVINGRSLAELEIKALHQRILEKNFLSGNGCYEKKQVAPAYLAAVCNNVRLLRPLRIVIDAGNGVAGAIAPALFKQLGCEVHSLYCEVDGEFKHHHPDPSQPENLQDLIDKVAEVQADIGLAFDGDGDRLGVVTQLGTIIWPDRLLMLFAQAVLAEHPAAPIIFDVKCTHHLGVMIEALGGKALMWKTGHSLIKSKMLEIEAKLAGEMSGHFFFKDRWYGFDDALYAGARLLEILAKHSETSDALFAAIPNSINTPELKILVTEEEKFSLMQQLMAKAQFSDAHDLMTIDGLRVNFQQGWGLIRPSNTTPYLILRFEAINEVILDHIQSVFRQWMLSVRPDLVLPF